MFTLNKFLIRPTDQFDPEYFKIINEEIAIVNTKTVDLPGLFKPEIIISFLKNHSIRNDFMKANPGLSALVTSGSLFTGHLESLFASCLNNPGYRQDFEAYLLKKFSAPS